MALERIQRISLNIILGKDYVEYISALEYCKLETLESRKDSYASLWHRIVLNLLNIVISSLLQFINMNTNYATRSSIIPGPKNIENLPFYIFRDC